MGMVINTKDLLQDISSIASVAMRDNFAKQGSDFGSRWAPLKQATIRDKNRKGFGAEPVLVRTGRMKGSIRPNKLTSKSVEVGSFGVDHTKYHDEGTRNMPKRQVVGITESADRDIKGLITKYMRRAAS